MAVPLHESLEGQVVLVTGATRGIGQEIAQGLVALGARVFGGARDPTHLTAASVEPVRMDVTKAEEVEAAVGHVDEAAGRLDVLVNNAGVYGRSGRPHKVAADEFDRILSTNLRGAFLAARHAVPLLTRRPGGRIVNLSSGAGSFAEGPYWHHAPYAVSKAGLNALTVCLSLAYESEGLIVNAVCPGWVATDMGGDAAPRSPVKGAQTPVWLARFKEGAPSGRFWRDQREIEW